MEPINLFQIVEATKGSLISNTPDIKISGVSIDSRTVSPGDLFIALKGENFNGHSFLAEAFRKGEVCAVISENINTALLERMASENKAVVKVADTLTALGDIAKIYKKKFDLPAVAITGSNGKTTTKKILSRILSKEFKTVSAKASFNNFVGVPLTLLEIKKDTEVVVLEMETNISGGIKRLCEIAHPSIGVVTNIGDTHLQSLKTKESVYREKLELVESLPVDGVAVLNSDDSYAVKMKESTKARRIITFGIKNRAEFSACRIRIKDRYLEFILNDRHSVRLNSIFYSNIYNAMAAIAVLHSVFGLSLEMIIDGLSESTFPHMRMELVNFKDGMIINDCYNANPQSMKGALLTLGNINVPARKVAVLGDMLELGDKAADFHRQIGRLCAACKIDILITVGALAEYAAEGARKSGMSEADIFSLESNGKTGKNILGILKPADTILIKGSRGMRMERIVEYLGNSTA